MEMEKAILGIRARRAPESKESTESSSEGSVRGEEGSLEDRRLSQEAFEERGWRIRREGLAVRLFVDDFPEDDALFEPRPHAEFVPEPQGGYWHESSPLLLRIRVKPLQGSTVLRDRRRRHSEEAFHIPLCYTDELHRFDLRDGLAGVRQAVGLYGRLRERYDGKRAVLRGWLHGTELRLSRHTTVEGNRLGELLTDDSDVRMFRAAGSFHRQDLQVAL